MQALVLASLASLICIFVDKEAVIKGNCIRYILTRDEYVLNSEAMTLAFFALLMIAITTHTHVAMKPLPNLSYFGIKTIHNMEVPGERQMGKPKRRSKDSIVEDMRVAVARREDAQDTKYWNKMIKAGSSDL